MKRAILASILALGVSSTAQAVNINPDGLGQVLFYPYYTVNGGNDTVFSLVNSTDEAKAVKVRFMESKVSREVLDFNLYLSAHDVWTATITMRDDVPTLLVRDTSCTTPYIYEVGSQEFLPWALDDVDEVERLAEGHIEVIEMGTLVGDSAEYATHEDGVPADCQALNDAWTRYTLQDDGYWILDDTTDIEAPSGGLYGGAAIINVPEGLMFSYDAYAIDGFSETEMHEEPGTIYPSLNSGDVYTGTVFVDGVAYTSPEFDRGVDAVSFVLMHNQLMNMYNVNPWIGGESEWVITFPTKSFYVDEVAADLPIEVIDEEEVPQALPPFTTVWDGEEACEPVIVNSLYDNEEDSVVAVEEPGGPVVSPSLPPDEKDNPAFAFCYETNVISFTPETAHVSPIFGSSNVIHIDPTEADFINGWLRLDLYNLPEGGTREGLGGLAGLPAVGFAVSSYKNGYVQPGVMANYNNIFAHKYTRAPVIEPRTD